MSPVGPWYISAAAVRQYQAIRGWPVVEDGPAWDRAERELIDAAREMAASGKSGTPTESGAVSYRTGRRWGRIYLIVSYADRAEGDLPQLVAVLPSHDRSAYRD